jgi:predicted nuclease with TOPRIM domain
LPAELNNLALLEDKIQKVTGLIQTLQKEKITLVQRLQKAEAEREALQKHQHAAAQQEEENRRLRQQLDRLEQERQDLRVRVQRILDLVGSVEA